MVSLADYIKRPITIQGQEIVLVPDMVGQVPISEQHQYVESCAATNTYPSIHVRESDIEEVRERHPGTRVFGLWHVLIHSGLVSLKRTLQIVPITEEDGYYIHCDLGRAEYSGIYEAGFFAADAGFSLEEAFAIDASVDQLVLPDNEAKLAAELRFERQLVARQSWSILALAVVGVVGIAFAINLGLSSFYDRAHQQVQNKTAMLTDLQSGLDKLRTTRLTEVPNDQVVLERLAILWKQYPALSTVGKQSMQSSQMLLESPAEGGFDPGPDYSWLNSRYDPTGSLEFRLTVKGG